MSVALMSPPAPVVVRPSPTARLVACLGQLKQEASAAGIADADLVLANIGDIKGVPELPVVKKARSAVTEEFGTAFNANSYPPYPVRETHSSTNPRPADTSPRTHPLCRVSPSSASWWRQTSLPASRCLRA